MSLGVKSTLMILSKNLKKRNQLLVRNYLLNILEIETEEDESFQATKMIKVKLANTIRSSNNKSSQQQRRVPLIVQEVIEESKRATN